MATEARYLPLAAAVALSCTTTSLGGDLARVRDLTDSETLIDVTADAVAPAPAEEVKAMLRRPLDSEAAVRVAILNNRALRGALRDMGVARGQLVQAGLLPNPLFEAEVLPEQNSALELRIEYDLTHALLTPMRRKVARAELEAARVRAAQSVIALGLQVRTAFFAVQSADQRLMVARQTLDTLAAARDTARALLEAGNITEVEAVNQEAAFERARVIVARLELELASRRERLNRLLGVHGPETGWKLAGKLPPVPETLAATPDLESRAVDKNLELAEMRSRLEALARRTGLSRAEGWIPELSVDVHALKAEEETGTPMREDWRYGGGVALTVPLFDRKQGQTTALAAQFDGLLERFYGTAVDVRSAAREAMARLMSAHARARQYQEVILPAQRRLTQQTLLQYNAMQLGVFQLLAARREELQAELDYIETLREHWTAAAGLNALLTGQRPGQTEMSVSSAGFGDATGEGH